LCSVKRASAPESYHHVGFAAAEQFRRLGDHRCARVLFDTLVHLAIDPCSGQKVENPLHNTCRADTLVRDQQDSPAAQRTDAFRQPGYDAAAEMNVSRDREEIKRLFRMATAHQRTSARGSVAFASRKDTFNSPLCPDHSIVEGLGSRSWF